MVGNVGRWPAKTNVWTRVTQDLGNGGPLGMLSITKPIKIKVLLHQFSLLMFNLHYMFLFTAFLPDRGIARIAAIFREMPHYIQPKGSPRAQRRKTRKKNNNNTLWALSFRHAFYLIPVVRVVWPV